MINDFETVEISTINDIQQIRIPKSMRINDEKVYLKKIGNSLYIVPYNNPLENLFESLTEFTDDFMNEREQPINQDREFFD